MYKNIQLVLDNSTDEKIIKSALFSLSAITRSTTENKIKLFDFQRAVDKTNSLPEIQKILCDLINDLKLKANCSKTEL